MDIPTLGPSRALADRRIRTRVGSDGGAHGVRVDFAPVRSGAPAPSHASHAWRVAETVAEGSDAHTPPRRRGALTWIRASGRDEDGVRVSDYTEPVAVRVPERPGLEGIRVHVDGGGAVALWGPTGTTRVVAIRWDVHDPEEEAEFGGTAFRSGDRYALPLRPRMGERATVELRPRDGGEVRTSLGEIVQTSEGEEVTVRQPVAGPALRVSALRPVDLGDVFRPRHWIWTSEGLPVRDSTRRLVHDSGAELPERTITTTAGLAVRTSTLDIVRTSA